MLIDSWTDYVIAIVLILSVWSFMHTDPCRREWTNENLSLLRCRISTEA